MKSLSIKKITVFILGVCIIQFGVALMLEANIGSDPYTVFLQGLGITLGITTGTASLIVLLVLIAVEAFIDRKKIKLGTIICAFFVGPILDLAVEVVSYASLNEFALPMKVLIVALGCFIVGIGLSYITCSDLGVAPNDILPFLVKERLHIKYGLARVSLDSIYFVIGLFLHGVIGVGTIVTLLCVGPFVQFWLSRMEKRKFPFHNINF